MNTYQVGDMVGATDARALTAQGLATVRWVKQCTYEITAVHAVAPPLYEAAIKWLDLPSAHAILHGGGAAGGENTDAYDLADCGWRNCGFGAARILAACAWLGAPLPAIAGNRYRDIERFFVAAETATAPAQEART
jgi:hypothetical protein